MVRRNTNCTADKVNPATRAFIEDTVSRFPFEILWMQHPCMDAQEGVPILELTASNSRLRRDRFQRPPDAKTRRGSINWNAYANVTMHAIGMKNSSLFFSAV